QGALAASLVGLVASYPLLNVPGATTYVLPFLPWETRESAAAWGGYAALGIANGCLLLALRARVQSLGGNALFEGRARWGAVLSFGAPVAALLVEALAENPLIDFGAQGAVVTALGIVSALYAALVYFDARLLWGRPRQGPAQAPSDVRERRR
ncbi:MAG TPA: hypothetical protein VNZ52_02035, partial [Candidatus Thermoplasmatota archaeon]|nr:hypothetical protein [Candidatus Thermoplasmatota archaeon]